MSHIWEGVRVQLSMLSLAPLLCPSQHQDMQKYVDDVLGDDSDLSARKIHALVSIHQDPRPSSALQFKWQICPSRFSCPVSDLGPCSPGLPSTAKIPASWLSHSGCNRGLAPPYLAGGTSLIRACQTWQGLAPAVQWLTEWGPNGQAPGTTASASVRGRSPTPSPLGISELSHCDWLLR